MATVLKTQPVNNLSDYALWLGVPNLSDSILKTFDPAYTGHVHIFVIRTPQIFDNWYKDSHAKNFKAILERASTSFTGLPELTLNFQDQVAGFADRKVSHATYSEMPFDQATIRCLEFKGLPVYNMMFDWITNISDPISKVGDYKGRADETIEYGLKTHSASFIVCTSDPSLTRLQGRAWYITAAMPVSITQEPFHWNSGEISIVDGFDLSFKGVLRWGDYVDAMAYQQLSLRKALINYYSDNAQGTKSMSKPVTL